MVMIPGWTSCQLTLHLDDTDLFQMNSICAAESANTINVMNMESDRGVFIARSSTFYAYSKVVSNKKTDRDPPDKMDYNLVFIKT